jgi:hypothetical protein
MRRTTGFLLGCLLILAVFALLLTNYHPASDSPSRQAAAPPVPETATAPLRGPAVQAVGNKDADDEFEMGDAPAPIVVGTAPGARQLDLTPQTWNQATEHYAATERGETADMSLQALWSPFRSQWAAQGFARRLALATGVSVEVVNESPGVYQVVFRYRDAAERRSHLQRIESITGLELEP